MGLARRRRAARALAALQRREPERGRLGARASSNPPRRRPAPGRSAAPSHCASTTDCVPFWELCADVDLPACQSGRTALPYGCKRGRPVPGKRAREPTAPHTSTSVLSLGCCVVATLCSRRLGARTRRRQAPRNLPSKSSHFLYVKTSSSA